MFSEVFDSPGDPDTEETGGNDQEGEISEDNVSEVDHCFCSCCASIDPGMESGSCSSPMIMIPKHLETKDRKKLKMLCRSLHSLVAQKTLPKMRSRTNVYLGNERDRGILLGVYTRMGVGITNRTHRDSDLLELIHAIASLRTDPTPYTSVYIGLSSGLPLHQDSNNFGHNDVTVFALASFVVAGCLWSVKEVGHTMYKAPMLLVV
eukprot:4861755-Amphidinium_carterae.1